MEEVLELVFKARSGDSHAFSKLAGVYKPLLNSLTQKYLKMCQSDGEFFDDFAQESQMALFEAVKTYDENSGFTFGVYAKSCIRNRLVSLVRRHRAKKREKGETKIPTGIPSPDDVYMTKELGKKLMAIAENSLSPYEKKVFALYLDGKRAGEISKQVGKSEKSVTNAIFRVRAKLKGINV